MTSDKVIKRYFNLEFFQSVSNIETRPCVLERLFFDEADLVIQFMQLFKEVSFSHCRLQYVSNKHIIVNTQYSNRKSAHLTIAERCTQTN